MLFQKKNGEKQRNIPFTQAIEKSEAHISADVAKILNYHPANEEGTRLEIPSRWGWTQLIISGKTNSNIREITIQEIPHNKISQAPRISFQYDKRALSILHNEFVIRASRSAYPRRYNRLSEQKKLQVIEKIQIVVNAFAKGLS